MAFLATIMSFFTGTKLFRNKWFWIGMVVAASLFVLWRVVDNYKDEIWDQIQTQISANRYKNQVELLQNELHELQQLNQSQSELVADIRETAANDWLQYQRDLERIRSSDLEGGTIGPYFSQTMLDITREDGISFEEAVRNSIGLAEEDDETENDQ